MGSENLMLIQNIYYSLTQLGFYDLALYNVLDRHGYHTEERIRDRYLSTAKYVIGIYRPEYDIRSLANETNRIRKIHGSVNDLITQQMYSDVLLVFCAPIYFFERYGIRLSQDDKLCFIELWAFLATELGIKDEYNVCLGGIGNLYPKIEKLIQSYLDRHDGNNKLHRLFTKHVYVPMMFIRPTEIFVVDPYLEFLCRYQILLKSLNFFMSLIYG